MRRSRWILAIFTAGALTASTAAAQTAKLSEWMRTHPAGSLRTTPLRDCTTGAISIGQTIFGAIDAQDCESTDNHFFDFYVFNGTAGQTLTATVTSASLTPMIIAFQSNSDGSVLLSNQGNSPVAVTYTLPSTGLYVIGLGSENTFAFGNYTLVLTAAGGGGGSSCQADVNTLCLLNGRYAVTASWVNSSNQSGNGTAITLTGDTGYFWFFDSSNVETVVKVLDGCAINGSRWVFASGLTNVQVTLMVVDTQGVGTMKTYTNPQGVAFQPIQDTSALPCD
jgi:hypothetical protein